MTADEPTDLARQTRAIAIQHEWTPLRVPDERGGSPARPGEHSVLVIGDDLAEPALLVVRDAETTAGLADECAARRQAHSEHVLAVLDELPPQRIRGRTVSAALVQHASRGSLRTLLEERPELAIGAAATILVAIARAVADLHTAGWAGATPTIDTVAFRADGCPVLGSLNGIRPLSAAGSEADRATFRAFAAVVCRAVPGRGAAGLLAAVEGALVHPGWDRVAVAVLRAAEPCGVLLPDPPPVAVAGSHDSRRRPARSLEGVLDALGDRPIARLAAVAGSWLRARPRLVMVAAVPLIVALLLLVLLQPDAETAHGEPRTHTPSEQRASSPSPPSQSQSAGDAVVNVQITGDPAVKAQTTDDPVAAVNAPATDGPVAAVNMLTADDPVAATAVLLEQWRSCIAASSPQDECLRTVLAPHFPAADMDQTLRTGVEATAPADGRGAQLSLVQRWGRAALVSVVSDPAVTLSGEPVSLLVVRSDTGWKVRDVLPTR